MLFWSLAEYTNAKSVEARESVLESKLPFKGLKKARNPRMGLGFIVYACV